jgi:hypothetical protein
LLAYLVVNAYEIAVLRILVKKHHPMKVSNLVEGFPDSSEDNVLQAISKLHFLGYVSIYDTPVQSISLSRDTKKEVLKIVIPNLNEESQTRQYYSSQRVVSPVSKNATEPKNNKKISLRSIVQTGSIVLAAIVIGSVIATGVSLLQYSPMANNHEPAGVLLLYHPASFLTTAGRLQPTSTSSSTTAQAQETSLNSFAVATAVGPGGGSLEHVFINDDNTFHRIIIEDDTGKVSNIPTTIYLKNAFVVLKI